MVTVIITTVLWQVFQIARIKIRMSFGARHRDSERQEQQPATREQ